jgi:pimeloyl-ACP methyl ester carboxylesterase
MNDLQWGSTHADALAGLGYTPVFVRYNTGLHIWDNGRELSRQLESLQAGWPVPVVEMAIVAHSMGGLVARSACGQAQQNGARWLPQLRHLVFLGTPHHGAPLERAGNWVDVLLGATPYSAPFAKLTRLRSAGITDLRHGRVEKGGGVLALPEGVTCHTVAATLAGRRSLLADRLVGDGLVPLRSALGRHDDPARGLAFEKSSEWIAWQTGHLELLSSEAVTRQLVHWLGSGRS